MARESRDAINGVFLKVHGPGTIPQVDFDRYMAELKDCEYSEEEAAQIVQTLVAIAEGFADLSWRICATRTACGKPQSPRFTPPQDSRNMLKSPVKSNQDEHDKNGANASPQGSRQ